jgi:hypothetical protein
MMVALAIDPTNEGCSLINVFFAEFVAIVRSHIFRRKFIFGGLFILLRAGLREECF